jgi:hypothetical protein
MTDVIAILALCISILLLVVEYINQLERRHGEIAHLRSDLMTKLSSIQQRINFIYMQEGIVRLELRKTTDNDDKYESIEMMPRVINGTKKIEEHIKELIGKLGAIDTTKKNTSKALIMLRDAQHDVKEMEGITSDAEKLMSELMDGIRANLRVPQTAGLKISSKKPKK